MRLKLDENIPLSLVQVLAQLGHDVHTVAGEGLGGSPDDHLWGIVVREGRFLITQDLDFSDVRRFAPGSHPGLLVLRLKTPGRSGLADRLAGIFRSEAVETWRGCFVIATERKVRVRRPPAEAGTPS